MLNRNQAMPAVLSVARNRVRVTVPIYGCQHTSDNMLHRLTALVVKLKDDLAQNLEQVEMLKKQVARLNSLVAARPTLEDAKFPDMASISAIWVQIFHSPNLTPKERKTKT